MAHSVFYFTDSTEVGGAEGALLLLIENLDRDVWSPTLLYHDSVGIRPLVQGARALGAATHAVTPAPAGLIGAGRVPGLVRELRGSRPDVFHAHLSWPLAAKYPLLSAVLARVPAVLATVHLCPEFRLEWSTYAQERIIAAGVDRYISVSEDVAASLARRLRWPRAKIEVIHNGVRIPQAPQRADPRLRRELTDDNAPLVLTVSRLTEQKGLDLLLHAAKLVPGAHFAVAGDGPERARLAGVAADLGIAERFRLLGRRDDIDELLAAADIFVLPSLWEGSSLAILEAMAAGKPVIATSIGGTIEVVVDGVSGVLVPPARVDALAEAIRTLLDDPGHAAALGRAARERAAAHFDVSATTARVTALYSQILHGKG